MQLVNKLQSIADNLFDKNKNKELSGHIPSDKKTVLQYHAALMTAGKAMNGMTTTALRVDFFF